MPIPTPAELDAFTYEELEELHRACLERLLARAQATIERIGEGTDAMRDTSIEILNRVRAAIEAEGDDSDEDSAEAETNPNETEDDFGGDEVDDEAPVSEGPPRWTPSAAWLLTVLQQGPMTLIEIMDSPSRQDRYSFGMVQRSIAILIERQALFRDTRGRFTLQKPGIEGPSAIDRLLKGSIIDA